MLCQTIKKDKNCFFWGDVGCTQVGGQCRPVVESCDGCSRVEDWPAGRYCASYPVPKHRWTLGICNMASHLNLEQAGVQRQLNPLKASKRRVGR